ncbi:MAG: DUF72 domain-containing protein [Longimicrobiales bacterium]
MRLQTGTSGFSYKEWKGSFYPPDLPASAMLAYYAERFPTVEINNTFYRMPSREVLDGWRAEVPASFCFVIKASRQITHIKRLKEVEQPVAHLLEVTATLATARGPLLFQLPPNMKKDVERLRTLLTLLPADVRAALEFRHESWYDDEVYAALREHGASFCITHTEDGDSPFVPTARWGYLRLRGVQYADDELRTWVERLRATDWEEVFVFFKHEDEATGPRLAARFAELFAR